MSHLLFSLLLISAAVLPLCVPAAARAAPATGSVVRQVPIDAQLGVMFALPAALPVGNSLGVGAVLLQDEVTASQPARWTWGGGVSASTATEYSQSWSVTHDEVRLRAILQVHQDLGRARVGLRLGVGATAVHEVRDRAQAGRLGESAGILTVSTWALLPGAELLPTIGLPIAAGWGVVLAAGPTVHWRDDGARWGWQGSLGARWTP